MKPTKVCGKSEITTFNENRIEIWHYTRVQHWETIKRVSELSVQAEHENETYEKIENSTENSGIILADYLLH